MYHLVPALWVGKTCITQCKVYMLYCKYFKYQYTVQYLYYRINRYVEGNIRNETVKRREGSDQIDTVTASTVRQPFSLCQCCLMWVVRRPQTMCCDVTAHMVKASLYIPRSLFRLRQSFPRGSTLDQRQWLVGVPLNIGVGYVLLRISKPTFN